MMRTRFQLVSNGLVDQLTKATVDEMRLVCVAVCKSALDRTGLDDPVLQDAVARLKEGKFGDQTVIVRLEKLVEELDEQSFAEQHRFEWGEGDENTYRAVFSKARAANAVLLSFGDDPFEAAAETMYEAGAAVDLDEVRSIFRRIVAEKR